MQYKRILFVLYNLEPLLSGRAKQAQLLAKELKYRGIEVDFISLDSSPVKSQQLNIRRWNYHAVKLNYLQFLIICSKGNYDAIHFHGFSYLVGMSGLIKSLGIRVILNMTCDGFDDPKTLLDQNWLGQFQRQGLKKLNAWIVQTPDSAYATNNTLYLPNAVVVPKSVKDWSKRSKNIVNLGVICPRKAQLTLIKKFKKVPDLAKQGWKLFICGSHEDRYSEHDQAYVNACIQAAKKTNGVIMTGHLSQNYLSDLLNNSKFFAVVSEKEGLSNAYLECMAWGVQPLLVSDKEVKLLNQLGLSASSPKWMPTAGLLEKLETSNFNCKDVNTLINNQYGVNQVIPRLIKIYDDPRSAWELRIKKTTGYKL